MQKALQQDTELFPWEALPPGEAAQAVSGAMEPVARRGRRAGGS